MQQATSAIITGMRVLGIETSCDETGVALYDGDQGLLALFGVAAAPDGSLLVADAGANAVFMIDAEGVTSTVATFADTMVEAPMMPEGEGEATEGSQESAEGGEEVADGREPAMMPMQQVPTHVTIGPHGAAYVTFLRGFPFTPGSAWVARIAEGEEPKVFASMSAPPGYNLDTMTEIGLEIQEHFLPYIGDDPKLAAMACFALTRMPGDPAAKALLSQLEVLLAQVERERNTLSRAQTSEGPDPSRPARHGAQRVSADSSRSL